MASIRRRIGQLEDDELEIMELVEPVDAERAQLTRERERLDAEGARLRTAPARPRSSRRRSSPPCKPSATRPPRCLTSSGRSTTSCGRAFGGVGIARLVGSTCQGCHLALPAVEVDRIRKLPLDEAVHCEEVAACSCAALIAPPGIVRRTRVLRAGGCERRRARHGRRGARPHRGPERSRGSRGAFVLVWLVFRSPAIDYRLVIMGALPAAGGVADWPPRIPQQPDRRGRALALAMVSADPAAGSCSAGW